MERRAAGLGVADVADLAAVEPLAGVSQHDALLLLPGRLDVHSCQGRVRDEEAALSRAQPGLAAT